MIQQLLSSTSKKPITVSIVSHGHLALIRPLLEQLDTYCYQVVHQVILTINIPEPDLLRGLKTRFSIVRIENAKPKGFGANQNQAFSHCATPWFLTLNPDIRLDSDVLSPLVSTAQPNTGIISPEIYEPEKAAPEQYRGLLTPLEILLRRRGEYVRPSKPAWIPGLFMLFRQETYAAIRGFDERYFMYGEDFDICARVQLMGWQIHVAPHLYVVHDARRASHTDRRHLYWHASSLLKVWTSPTFWRFRQWWRRSKLN